MIETSCGNKMGANLINSLQEIKDFQTSQGRRYPLWLVLLLVVMGTLSGCRSYYALEDFGARHYGGGKVAKRCFTPRSGWKSFLN